MSAADLLNVPADMLWMRQMQARSMFDQCLIVRHSVVPGPYNEPVASYQADAEPVACGYNPGPGKYKLSSTEVVSYDAVVRLPAGTIIDERGGLTIISQAGQSISARSYEFSGPIEYGATAITARCSSVIDGRF